MFKKIGECVYCGKIKHLTKDHIPPKCLFSSPKPNNLITVPCCNKCNNNASKDDEYFRFVLTAWDGAFEHPDVRNNWPKVKSSLENPHKEGFKKAISNSVSEVSCFTPSGIYFDQRGVLNVDFPRIVNGVIERIVKRFFYHKIGKRLPNNYQVVITPRYNIHKLNEKQQDWIRQIIMHTRVGEPVTIGNDVFSYWIKFLEENKNVFATVMRFYEKVEFVSFSYRDEA